MPPPPPVASSDSSAWFGSAASPDGAPPPAPAYGVSPTASAPSVQHPGLTGPDAHAAAAIAAVAEEVQAVMEQLHAVEAQVGAGVHPDTVEALDRELLVVNELFTRLLLKLDHVNITPGTRPLRKAQINVVDSACVRVEQARQLLNDGGVGSSAAPLVPASSDSPPTAPPPLPPAADDEWGDFDTAPPPAPAQPPSAADGWGDVDAAPAPAAPAPTPAPAPAPLAATHSTPDDDWGDFESSSAVGANAAAVSAMFSDAPSSTGGGGDDDWGDFESGAGAPPAAVPTTDSPAAAVAAPAPPAARTEDADRGAFGSAATAIPSAVPDADPFAELMDPPSPQGELAPQDPTALTASARQDMAATSGVAVPPVPTSSNSPPTAPPPLPPAADDEWGDFDTAPPPAPAQPPSAADGWGDVDAAPAPAAPAPTPAPAPAPLAATHSTPDDDWGDFESSSAVGANAAAVSAMFSDAPSSTGGGGDDDWGDFESGAGAPPAAVPTTDSPAAAVAAPAPPAAQTEDADWGAFGSAASAPTSQPMDRAPSRSQPPHRLVLPPDAPPSQRPPDSDGEGGSVASARSAAATPAMPLPAPSPQGDVMAVSAGPVSEPSAVAIDDDPFAALDLPSAAGGGTALPPLETFAPPPRPARTSFDTSTPALPDDGVAHDASAVTVHTDVGDVGDDDDDDDDWADFTAAPAPASFSDVAPTAGPAAVPTVAASPLPSPPPESPDGSPDLFGVDAVPPSAPLNNDDFVDLFADAPVMAPTSSFAPPAAPLDGIVAPKAVPMTFPTAGGSNDDLVTPLLLQERFSEALQVTADSDVRRRIRSAESAVDGNPGTLQALYGQLQPDSVRMGWAKACDGYLTATVLRDAIAQRTHTSHSRQWLARFDDSLTAAARSAGVDVPGGGVASSPSQVLCDVALLDATAARAAQAQLLRVAGMAVLLHSEHDPASSMVVATWVAVLDRVNIHLQRSLQVLQRQQRKWDAAVAALPDADARSAAPSFGDAMTKHPPLLEYLRALVAVYHVATMVAHSAVEAGLLSDTAIVVQRLTAAWSGVQELWAQFLSLAEAFAVNAPVLASPWAAFADAPPAAPMPPAAQLDVDALAKRLASMPGACAMCLQPLQVAAARHDPDAPPLHSAQHEDQAFHTVCLRLLLRVDAEG